MSDEPATIEEIPPIFTRLRLSMARYLEAVGYPKLAVATISDRLLADEVAGQFRIKPGCPAPGMDWVRRRLCFVHGYRTKVLLAAARLTWFDDLPTLAMYAAQTISYAVQKRADSGRPTLITGEEPFRLMGCSSSDINEHSK